MKKEYRIKKTQEFQSIMSKKQYSAKPSVVIYCAKKCEEHARVGISVSKKLGNAVQRNKIKRQLRMMLQEMASQSYPYDAIIIARNAYSSQSYQQNKKDLESCFKNVRIR